MIDISVCMGSSCFSRGNGTTAELVQRFVAENGLTDTVRVRGCLCENQCKSGPNIKIDGKLFTQVEPAGLELLLKHELGLDK